MTTSEGKPLRTPGRKPERERARILKALLDDLARCKEDSGLSLTYEAIQERTGVSRRHLSNASDEEYTRVAEAYARLKLERAGVDAEAVARDLETAASFADAHMSDAALAGRTDERLSEIARLLRDWLSRHGKPDAAMAALALHDLDMMLGLVYRQAVGLRPLVRERGRREDVKHAASRREAGLGPGIALMPQMTLEDQIGRS